LSESEARTENETGSIASSLILVRLVKFRSSEWRNSADFIEWNLKGAFQWYWTIYLYSQKL